MGFCQNMTTSCVHYTLFIVLLPNYYYFFVNCTQLFLLSKYLLMISRYQPFTFKLLIVVLKQILTFYLHHLLWSGVGVYLVLWAHTWKCQQLDGCTTVHCTVYTPFTVNTILGLFPAASQPTFYTLYSWCVQCCLSPSMIIKKKLKYGWAASAAWKAGQLLSAAWKAHSTSVHM